MQMATGSDGAIGIDRNTSIDECFAIDFGARMDRSAGVDSMGSLDNHGRFEPFANRSKGLMRIGNDDLRDGEPRKWLGGDDCGGLGSGEFISVLDVVDERDATWLSLGQRESSQENHSAIVGIDPDQFTVNLLCQFRECNSRHAQTPFISVRYPQTDRS
jgi:hypothetical protein